MKDLNLRITLQAFDKVSKPFEGIRSAGVTLAKSFNNDLKGLRNLNTQMQ